VPLFVSVVIILVVSFHDADGFDEAWALTARFLNRPEGRKPKRMRD
jgi:hypothetical protein